MKYLSWLGLATFMLAAVSAPSGARADQYPSQDIHVICAFPAGSGADVLVRYFADKLKTASGRTVIVENKPGAGGNIAAEYTTRAKPDGYTILIHAGTTLASGKSLIKNNPVDPAKQIQVAATINRQAHMLVVDAKRPWGTLADLTAYLKEKGDKATYATVANSGVVMAAMYKEVMGLKAVEVNYKLAQDSLNDMASGAIDFGAHDPIFALSQAREGRLRILAVATDQRLKANPEIPTMSELGVKMDLLGWFAAMVPSATPRPIVDQINAWFRQILSTAETKTFLNNFGGDPWISTPEEGQARLISDINAWVDYVRIAKLTPQ